jgi:hypothetical protein
VTDLTQMSEPSAQLNVKADPTRPITPEELDDLLQQCWAPSDFATLIRRVNATNGWRPDHTPAQAFADIHELLNLTHTEISEAFREGDPHHHVLELGDVIVRAADICTLIAPDVPLPGHLLDGAYPISDRQQWLLGLHAHIDDATQAWRKAPSNEEARPVLLEDLHHLIRHTHYLIAAHAPHTRLTSRRILAEILVKNLQRGHRHGGRRA